jgi:hypothetical protein
MTSVCSHPLLRRSPALLAFLKFEDEQKYQEFKKEIEDSEPVYEAIKNDFTMETADDFHLKHIRSLDGTFKCRVNKDMHTYAVEAENMIAQSATSYSTLHSLSQRLIDEFSQVSLTIDEMATELGNLQALNRDFNDAVIEGKISNLGVFYTDAKKSMEDWSRQINKNSVLVKENLLKTFKHSMAECDSALELIRVRNSASHGYFTAVKSINETKESLLDDKDPSKWGLDQAVTSARISPDILLHNREIAKYLMMPQKRRPLYKLKLIFGYLNDQMIRELTWFADEKVAQYTKTFRYWGNERIEVLNEEARSLDEFMIRLNYVPTPIQV